MTDHSQLVTRLRITPAVNNETLAARIAMDEAADAIDALQARVEALEAGHRPYADVAERDIGDDEADADIFRPMTRYNRAGRITVGDLRRSRALLERKPS